MGEGRTLPSKSSTVVRYTAGAFNMHAHFIPIVTVGVGKRGE